jgi:hypothetical protein
MSTTDTQFYSRSALAEKLNMSLKELTQLMLSGGWIIEVNKGLELSAKGEFEGGKYRQSSKYGQYIVWPESIVEHALLRNIDAVTVTVSQLLKQAQLLPQTNLPPRLFNRLLAELGWISPFSKGWKTTQQGSLQGGEQYEDDSSGMPYVKWPRALLSNDNIISSLNTLSGLSVSHQTSTKDGKSIRTLNGVLVENIGQAKISNWLYLLGFNASYQRKFIIDDKQSVKLDFYLPKYRLAIEYWDESLKTAQLSLNLSRQEFHDSLELNVIEINHRQLEDLDQVISKELLHLGISVY